MKQYTVLADSITGFRNKQLKNGKTYKAHDFIQKDIPHLLSIKAIEEVEETKTLTEADIEANPLLKQEGKQPGDTIVIGEGDE